MPFRFPLETLLRFRRSIERQQELRLLEAYQRVAALRQEIEELSQRKAGLAEQERRDLAEGVSGAQLHFHILLRSLLARQREALERELVRCEELRRQRHLEFQRARQQREAVTALRDSQLRAYAQLQSRSEQRRLDDLFLLRREFLRRQKA
jgi:flagellar export protein FliJ